MAAELTVTAKGQVTLRQSVLEHLGIGSGHKVSASLLPDGRVELRAAADVPGISALRGALHRPGQAPVSLQAMQDAIEAGSDPA